MPKTNTRIKPESGKRLYDWLKQIGMTEIDLAEKIGYTSEYVSMIVTGKKPMTVTVAELVSKNTSSGKSVKYGYEVRIREAYLLCLDDIKTNEDFEQQFIRSSQATSDAILNIIDFALKEVHLIEGIDIPNVSPGEALFLYNLVQESAINIVWSYMKNRDHSPLWTFIDGKQKA